MGGAQGDDAGGGDGRSRWRLDQIERCVRRGMVLEASTLIDTAPDGAARAIRWFDPVLHIEPVVP